MSRALLTRHAARQCAARGRRNGMQPFALAVAPERWVLAAALIGGAAAQGCQYNAGPVQVDFTQLNNGASGWPVPIGPDGAWGSISINPCLPLSCPGVVGDSLCCLTSTPVGQPASVFSCGAVGQFTTELADPALVVGIEQTLGNVESCGAVQTSIAFRCNDAVPPPGILEWVPPTDPLRNPCIYNISWTVSTVCPLPPSPGGPLPEDEDGTFALVTFLVVFLGGGLYFVGGTLVNSRLPNASSVFYNNIPQKDFWFDLPSLVQDGVAFSASLGKHKGKKQFIDGYEDVDEEQEALTISDAPGSDDEGGGSGGGGVRGAMANSSTTTKKKKKKKPKPKPKTNTADEEPKE